MVESREVYLTFVLRAPSLLHKESCRLSRRLSPLVDFCRCVVSFLTGNVPNGRAAELAWLPLRWPCAQALVTQPNPHINNTMMTRKISLRFVRFIEKIIFVERRCTPPTVWLNYFCRFHLLFAQSQWLKSSVNSSRCQQVLRFCNGFHNKINVSKESVETNAVKYC